ncbi:MAG TPA: hypothetical protein VMV69_16475 [Pirellulales bacterium]|nr:hypothetical protein [Pirellulales bacterium]
MVSAVAEHLGVGIYSPAEAALYARERTGTINRWLFGTPKNAPVVSNQLATEEKVVTFLDFIQILAIADIRKQFDVPLQTIRQAVDKAKERYRVAFPFALRHKTYLFERAERVKKNKESKETATEEAGGEGGRRFEIVLATGADGDGLVQLTGPKADSYMIKDVIEAISSRSYLR